MPIPNESCMPVQEEICRSIQESFSVNHTTKNRAHSDLKANAFFAQISPEESLPTDRKERA